MKEKAKGEEDLTGKTKQEAKVGAHRWKRGRLGREGRSKLAKTITGR